jgi:hypothetical protein
MTMITTEPPAERDVSPVRHAELRADAMRQITERRRPSWAVPSVAAAVTAVLIAGAAAVPTLRHQGAAGGPLPGLLVATYSLDKDNIVAGGEIYDPTRGRYLVQRGAEWMVDLSPDLRWASAYKDTFDQVRITAPGQVLDTHAGLVDPAAVQAWSAGPGGLKWADDGSRFYLVARTAPGARLLGIDPATRKLVSSTAIDLPAGHWSVLSADPRDGFAILLDSGVLRRYAPNGVFRDARQVTQPNPPNVVGGGAVYVSPDHTRVAVGARDGTHVIDLRTGAEKRASTPGYVAMWAGASHYVTFDDQGDHIDVRLVDARTGRAVGHVARLPLVPDRVAARILPFDGPAPPGADTLTF